MFNIDAFVGYSAALDDMPDHIAQKTLELVWSYRAGVLSLCWVTDDLEAFIEYLGGSVPQVITNAYSRRYAVDLESIGTDKIRLYIDSPNEGEVLIGYYFDSLASDATAYEYKIYKRNGREGVLVDRFSPDGTLISSDEGEVMTNVETDWKGPSSLLAICKDQPQELRILKKVSKDQSYLRIE